MTIEEIIAKKPSLRTLIAKIVGDKDFLDLKDAFVSNVPAGEGDGRETPIAVAQGKYLGTRFVFNEMERIAQTKPESKNPKPDGKRIGDPDLDS